MKVMPRRRALLSFWGLKMMLLVLSLLVPHARGFLVEWRHCRHPPHYSSSRCNRCTCTNPNRVTDIHRPATPPTEKRHRRSLISATLQKSAINGEDDSFDSRDMRNWPTPQNSQNPIEPSPGTVPPSGLRINRVFQRTHSRRAADRLVAEGRVKRNGSVVRDAGCRVQPHDQIELDGRPYDGWSDDNNAWPDRGGNDPTSRRRADASQRPNHHHHHRNDESAPPPLDHEYIKYWKPTGITCTMDPRVPGNLIEALNLNSMDHYPSVSSPHGNDTHHQSSRRRHGSSSQRDSSAATDPLSVNRRLFPVGRLDRDTEGLLLLTSDGRVPNAVLRGRTKQPKTYVVVVDRPIDPQHLEDWRRGVVITTEQVRARGRRPTLTAPTRPARRVRLLNKNNPRVVELVLEEGRNRQVRKMMAARGYRVRRLVRTDFMGITLQDMEGCGDWRRLSSSELDLIRAAVAKTVVPHWESN